MEMPARAAMRARRRRLAAAGAMAAALIALAAAGCGDLLAPPAEAPASLAMTVAPPAEAAAPQNARAVFDSVSSLRVWLLFGKTVTEGSRTVFVYDSVRDTTYAVAGDGSSIRMQFSFLLGARAEEILVKCLLYANGRGVFGARALVRLQRGRTTALTLQPGPPEIILQQRSPKVVDVPGPIPR